MGRGAARVGTFVLLAAACGEPTPLATAPSAVSAPRPSSSAAVSSAGVAPSSSAVAVPSARVRAVPTIFPNEPERDAPVPGSTQGTIACGRVRCDATQERCRYASYALGLACAERRTPVGDLDAGDGTECDDASDCPTANVCCRRLNRNAGESAVCVAAADAESACEEEYCAEGGAPCSKGECSKDATGLGVCVVERPVRPASCAGGRKCPLERPICAVSAGGAFCVASGSKQFRSVKADHRYECTRHSDCSENEVCAHVYGEIEHQVETYCTRMSPSVGTLVCDREESGACGSNKACYAKSCVNYERALPWMGVWTPPSDCECSN